MLSLRSPSSYSGDVKCLVQGQLSEPCTHSAVGQAKPVGPILRLHRFAEKCKHLWRSGWLCQGFLDRHPGVESFSQRGVTHPKFTRPRREWLGHPVESQRPVISLVRRLLRVGRPSAIARFVVAVLVRKPVNRVARAWARSHVCQERCEVVTPRLAHTDAASSVVPISDARWRVAPLKYSGPDAVLVREGRAVFRPRCHRLIAFVTTTTLRASRRERVDVRYGLTAAVARATPAILRTSLGDLLNSHQSAKSLACEV